jgi:hypothetical protein
MARVGQRGGRRQRPVHHHPVPKQTPHTTGLTHSITWLLLALSFLIRGLAPNLSTLADAVGLLGLGAYIAFRTAISQIGRLRA